MVSKYYTIKFNVLDMYESETYDHEVEFDTLEEAEKEFDRIIAEFEKDGEADYYSMELMECGGGEEAYTLEIFWFE